MKKATRQRGMTDHSPLPIDHSRLKTTNMKIRIIGLLIVLFGCSLAASPNRNCDRARCAGKPKQVTVTPAKKVMGMIDDLDLLPIHGFFNNF